MNEELQILEITARERGMLLRALEHVMDQYNQLPFTNHPDDYWVCHRLKSKLYGEVDKISSPDDP